MPARGSRLSAEDLERIFPGESEMARRMRAFDWSTSDVGQPETWPVNLRISLSLCLTSPFPMFVWWGPQYTILYNDAYISFLGRHKHPGVLGRPGREAWYDIWETIEPMLRGVREDAKAAWAEDILMFFDRDLPKEEVYVTFSFSPVFGDGSKVDGIHCACTEVTEKIVGARRLETLRKLGLRGAAAGTVEDACKEATRAIAENPQGLPFAALYVLEQGGGRARLAAKTGVPDGEHLLPSEVSMDQGDATPWPLVTVLRTNRPVELDNLPAHGIEIPGGAWPELCTRAILLPIPGPTHDAPLGVIVLGISPRRPYTDDYRTFHKLVAGHVGTAISDAMAYEEERRRAEALAELDQAKTQFFSNVSHEFRTPLTLLLGPVEEALRGPRRTLEGEPLEAVHRNGIRLLKLVNSLLDFSRIEAGRIQAVFERVDLSALTRDLASVFRSAIERAGLRLVVDCAPISEDVYVDRSMWEKVVLNLLSNALKFTFEGEIAVRLRTGNGRVSLEVSDTGTGIPAREMPRLFERFHRVQGARARSHEGSGIGLALVHELVKLHGGTISAESVEGKGTTFEIEFPTGKAHLPPEKVGKGTAGPSSPIGAAPFLEEALGWTLLESAPDAPAPAADVVAPGARILLADDNADMRAYIQRLLRPRWAVEVVGDGEAALERARKNPPDLVLSDVMMPRLDGLGLLRALRDDERTCTIPVILVSARAGEEAKLEGLEWGADDYLIKPFSAQELIGRVSSHLKLAQLRKESQAQLREINQNLERRVEERTRKLSEALRELETFSYTIAHDLRAPLRAMSHFSHLLLEDHVAAVDLTGQDYARRLEEAARRMDALVVDLLEYSRLAREDVPLVPVETKSIIEEALRAMSPQLESRAAQVDVAGEFPSVRAHAGSLAQVLTNLIDNASKFVPPGRKPRVRLHAETRSGKVRLWVEDNGIGIPAEHHSQIFGLFQRLHRPEEYPGTGVGLAIVKKAVEKMGGEIGVESEDGQGSRFFIELPQADGA